MSSSGLRSRLRRLVYVGCGCLLAFSSVIRGSRPAFGKMIIIVFSAVICEGRHGDTIITVS